MKKKNKNLKEFLNVRISKLSDQKLLDYLEEGLLKSKSLNKITKTSFAVAMLGSLAFVGGALFTAGAVFLESLKNILIPCACATSAGLVLSTVGGTFAIKSAKNKKILACAIEDAFVDAGDRDLLDENGKLYDDYTEKKKYIEVEKKIAHYINGGIDVREQ